MDQVKLMDVVESIQDLLGHLLQSGNVEVVLLLDLSVVLGVLVEVVSKQFRNNNEMLLVIKVVDHPQQVLLVQVVSVALDESEQLDLVNALVEVVFVVFNNFHADHLLSVDVVTLDCLREGSRAEILHNLISSSNDGVHDNWEVFGLLKPCLLAIKHYLEVVAIIHS